MMCTYAMHTYLYRLMMEHEAWLLINAIRLFYQTVIYPFETKRESVPKPKYIPMILVYNSN